MADIVLTCLKCGGRTTISNYVSTSNISCSSCGENIPVPDRKKTESVIRLRKSPSVEAPPPPAAKEAKEQKASKSGVAAVVQGASDRVSREERKLKPSAVKLMLGWALFIVLSAALGYFRFAGGIPAMDSESIIRYGLIGVGAVYIIIILLAVKDNMFDGLLCIVVPFYPFYYILFVSNLLFVRSVVAALLLVFGYDLVLLLNEQWNRAFEKINEFIRSA